MREIEHIPTVMCMCGLQKADNLVGYSSRRDWHVHVDSVHQGDGLFRTGNKPPWFHKGRTGNCNIRQAVLIPAFQCKNDYFLSFTHTWFSSPKHAPNLSECTKNPSQKWIFFSVLTFYPYENAHQQWTHTNTPVVHYVEQAIVLWPKMPLLFRMIQCKYH